MQKINVDSSKLLAGEGYETEQFGPWRRGTYRGQVSETGEYFKAWNGDTVGYSSA